MSRLDTFTQAYITCALWCGLSGDTDSYLEGGKAYTQFDISDTTLRVMREDCTRFFAEIEALLPYGTEEQAGHDFWLTRNGHGAGFWDRAISVYGSEETRDNLNVLCKNFRTIADEGMPPNRWGEFELYIGDDGKVYHS